MANADENQAELAKKLNNPIAGLVSVPTRFSGGPEARMEHDRINTEYRTKSHAGGKRL